MVLIISDNSDISTNHVIEWIDHLGYPFYKLTPEDKVSINKLSLNDFELVINKRDVIHYSHITSCWFRRGYINFDRIHQKAIDKTFAAYFINHLNKEFEAYYDFIHFLLLKKRHIGTNVDYHINKFVQLELASKLGILTPQTYFVKSRDQLKSILKDNEIVTKSSNFIFDFVYGEESYLTYTEKLDTLQLKKIPKSFMLSVCQNNIPKICDIRVFYLDENMYSMAIMSQDKESTKIDFRKYDFVKPSKSVPFEIPVNIQNSIVLLMKELKLISGSLDFILNHEGDLVFLEVNPIGQYGMVDYPCNYGLNLLIANYLTSKFIS